MVVVDAEFSRHGQQQGSDDHERRAAFNEHTHDEKDQVAEHEERILVGGKVQHCGGDYSREVYPGHVLTEDVRGDHDKHNAGGAGDGIEKDGDKVLLEAELSIDEPADEEAVKNRDGAAFRGSEQAEAHTEDDAEREEQAPEGDKRLLQDFLDRGELIAGLGVVALLGDDSHGDHHGKRHEDTGNITGGESTAKGRLRDKAEDDKVDSGRNNGGSGRRGRGDGGGESLGIAALFHLGDEHFGLHGAVGVSGARAAAHQHGQQHVDLSKAAAHMARDAFTEVHHLVADTAEVHDRAGHDEERDSKHGEGLSCVHDLLEKEPALGVGVKNEEVEKRGAEQRVDDGETHEVKEENEQYRNDLSKCQCHQKFPPST